MGVNRKSDILFHYYDVIQSDIWSRLLFYIEQIPGYLKAFDVCLIPYVADDPSNIHCSPLKLSEYLGTGKPIVSNELPGVKPFDGLVRIARDGVEFEQHVVESLNEQGETMCQQRLAIAQENSWEKRIEQILQIVDSTLKERCP